MHGTSLRPIILFLQLILLASAFHLNRPRDTKLLSVDGENTRTADFSALVNAAGGRLPGANRSNPQRPDIAENITITDSVADQLAQWSTKLGI